jgi:hypothetical protein
MKPDADHPDREDVQTYGISVKADASGRAPTLTAMRKPRLSSMGLYTIARQNWLSRRAAPDTIEGEARTHRQYWASYRKQA